ncbi:ArnT family glycosyltransferase [Dictyobacter kobayashii]|uniref:Glycosyltransferase RgtA/B/C/D-like domain-containing protein n=1 Tax=Dictyobacter kobayashii TaxID=2014872 RepID=A0A402AV69_9CHLR|nr:hypothetical protein [Dictyobacter kobayashii]GCE22903.1 hypothetical protein KDK_67030 [Dictyobacter kobayashii]
MNFSINLKRFRIGKHERYLLGLLVFATLVRLLLIYFNWPTTNSDETNMGLVARHIAYNGDWPIFFYGQPYMGPVEAYLAAPLFHLLGPSLFALRLELLLFFVLFLLGMYILTSLLHTQKLGLFVCLLFSFGSPDVIARQLKAVGEYPETEFFAVAICVITIWLALSVYAIRENKRTSAGRIFIYGVLGLIIGLSLWVDMLILPFVCMGIVFLLLFCRRECFSWAGLSLVIGTLIGLIPLIIYNLSVPFDQNSINILLHIHNTGTNAHPSLGQQFVGAFGVGMPGGLGLDPVCSLDQFPYFGHAAKSCMLTHFSWSAGYIILWCIATFMSLATILQLWQARQGSSLWRPVWTFEQKRQLIIECGRLMVLICAIGTLFLFVTSPVAGSTPGPTSRYLTCMLISMPMILWPLWKGLIASLMKFKSKEILFPLIRLTVIGLILFVFVAGTFRVFIDEVPTAQADYQRQQQVVQNLNKLNLKYIYSEYWTCNNIIFFSQEKIICGVVTPQLNAGYNRYPAFWKAVRQASRVGYIFPVGSVEDLNFIKRLKMNAFPILYQSVHIPGYHVYLPK